MKEKQIWKDYLPVEMKEHWTVQQSAKDNEDICRRADARQRYLTPDFTLC